MNEEQIMAQLTDLFRELFDDDAIVLRPDTTADDIDGWDSFTHLNMIIAVDGRFGIRIHPKEVESMANIGDLARIIKAHKDS